MRQAIDKNYSCASITADLRASFQRARSALPFFIKCLLILKMAGYFTEWIWDYSGSIVLNTNAVT